MSGLLSMTGLSVRYPGTETDAVHAVDLEVAGGEVVGVVGESGSGKTTLGLSVLGLLPPGSRTSGSIRFEDRELVGASERSMRRLRGRTISTVVQNPATALNPAFPIGSQLATLLRRQDGLSRGDAHRRAVEMLGLVGFPDPERRMRAYPHELSGGMNQRVVIAMALALSPRLVVADEPTSALDVTVQAAILTLLRRLIDDAGSSMVLITHDLGVVAQMCSRVVVMNGGRVVESGECQSELHAQRCEVVTKIGVHLTPLGRRADHRSRRMVYDHALPTPPNWCWSDPGRLQPCRGHLSMCF